MGLVLGGCRSGKRLEVQGSFDTLWAAAQGVVTNQGFTIISTNVPDLRLGRKHALVEGRRLAGHPAEGAGVEGFLSHREPWDLVWISVHPIEPRTNDMVRRLTVTATTEKTDLMILKGRRKELPAVQADVVAALLQWLAEKPDGRASEAPSAP